jgi:hypothetical protein
MKKTIVAALAGLLALPALTLAQLPQNPPPVPAGSPPDYAFDITAKDVDMVLKTPPGGDRQLRVVDMGKYNLGVGIIHRGPPTTKLEIQSTFSITTTRRKFTSSSPEAVFSQPEA